MQTINQLTTRLIRQQNNNTLRISEDSLKNESNSETQETLISEQQILSLFAGFKKIFGSKDKLEKYDLDMVTIWHIALNILEMSQDDFAKAKRESLKLAWSPTAPRDFYNLAVTDKYSDYLSTEQAYKEAVNNTHISASKPWSSAIVYETCLRIGYARIQRNNGISVKDFECIYRKVIEEHKKGTVFSLPELLPKPVPRLMANENIDAMFEQYGFNKNRNEVTA